MKEIIEKLTELGYTISTMESCTGGCLANAITNIEGASEVLKFSAVTYSNEFKIKMGVSSEVIDKYSVYSMETAREMALNISKFTNSNIGIGITGKLNRADKNNNFGEDNEVFICIYDGEFHNLSVKVSNQTRKENKEEVINFIVEKLGEIINEKNKQRKLVHKRQ